MDRARTTQRHELESNRAERRDSRTLHTERTRDSGKLHLEAPEINRKKRRKEVWVEKRGKKSFVDVVKGETQQKWKGPIIKTQHHVLPWMKNSAIGEVEGGKVVGGGEQNTHMTKVLFEESSSKSKASQSKADISFTNEEKKDHKVGIRLGCEEGKDYDDCESLLEGLEVRELEEDRNDIHKASNSGNSVPESGSLSMLQEQDGPQQNHVTHGVWEDVGAPGVACLEEAFTTPLTMSQVALEEEEFSMRGALALMKELRVMEIRVKWNRHVFRFGMLDRLGGIGVSSMACCVGVWSP
ncbi:hypothetical protein VNO80_30570 [Phaseolus coccineus]|uniref:Uncharacterized protein n=1 Tax=Phaseolus coccineus TaxID=3886 RepID=A0AAN9LE40_PHACN